jgi:hypothetical protein
MCNLEKQCVARKGACVEQRVVYFPIYLSGEDCGQSDKSRAGQDGGMIPQEMPHLSPCPKYRIDNAYDPCAFPRKFLIPQNRANTESILESPA